MIGQNLEIQDLYKSFGKESALAGLSLSLKPGEKTLLLGHNGSGKSTLLRACAGLLRPDRGGVLSGSKSVAPKNIGYVAHDSMLFEALTVSENLVFFAGLMQKMLALDSELARWNLSDVANRRVGSLSRGTQARISLCRAFLGSPAYLFLDEPSAALDDQSVGILKRELTALAGSTAALMATHDLPRLGDLANRIVVLALGQVVADSSSPGQSLDSAIDSYRRLNR